jgi:Zn finger protein HypA/HybF involved in hydrogenase expression
MARKSSQDEVRTDLGDQFVCRHCDQVWYTLHEDGTARLPEHESGEICPSCHAVQLEVDEEDLYDGEELEGNFQ